MFSVYKKCLVIMFVFLFVGITNGFVFAYSTQITLDARGDAGLIPGENAYLRFVDQNNTQTVLYDTASDPQWTINNPQWTTADEVKDYAWYTLNIKNWLLESAGNIWSTIKTVGESLSGLHAGTYRISVVDGAFEYDSFNWSNYYNQWLWRMHIQADGAIINGNIMDYDYTLGSHTRYNSPGEALTNNYGSYIDIPLAEGGSLDFWIWDWNAIDNSGSLTFNVTSVPEPSTFLLLTLGLAFLMRRIRS